MIAWILAAIFATACASLLWQLVVVRRLLLDAKAQLLGDVELLRREKDVLLRTALEAQGKSLIEEGRGPRHVEVAQKALRSRIEGRLGALEAEDRKRAQDRDARVAEEIEAARRAASSIGNGIGINRSDA